MNKYKKTTILALASFVIIGSTVFATTGKVFNTSQGLVLRGSASKSGEPLATVADGAEVEVLEKDGDWYKVNASGKEGYLFAEYVKVEEEIEKPEENTENDEDANQIKSETRIHILPLITSSIVGIVPADGKVTTEKTVGNWNYITFENVKGWIRNVTPQDIKTPEESKEPEKEEEKQETREETKPTENTNLSFIKGYINSSSVNVRKEPNTSSQILTTLILNTGVTLTAQTDEWYKIEYGHYNGYIHKSLISENPVATSRNGEAREALIEEEKAEVAANAQQEQSQSEPVVSANVSVKNAIIK